MEHVFEKLSERNHRNLLLPGLYISVFGTIVKLPIIYSGTFCHARRFPFTFITPPAIGRMLGSAMRADQIFKYVRVPVNDLIYEPPSFSTPISNFPSLGKWVSTGCVVSHMRTPLRYNWTLFLFCFRTAQRCCHWLFRSKTSETLLNRIIREDDGVACAQTVLRAVLV